MICDESETGVPSALCPCPPRSRPSVGAERVMPTKQRVRVPVLQSRPHTPATRPVRGQLSFAAAQVGGPAGDDTKVETWGFGDDCPWHRQLKGMAANS